MGRAEDAIYRRRAEAEYARQQREWDEAARARAVREAFILDVENLTPAALAGLERADWPKGTLLRVYRRFGSKEVAGWPVGGYRFENPDGGSTGGQFNQLFLLRDGGWLYGWDKDPRKPQTFRAIVEYFAGIAHGPSSLMLSELPEGVIEELERLAHGRPS